MHLTERHGNLPLGLGVVAILTTLGMLQFVILHTRPTTSASDPLYMVIAASFYHASQLHFWENIITYTPVIVSSAYLVSRRAFLTTLTLGVTLPYVGEFAYDILFSTPGWVVGFSPAGLAFLGLCSVVISRRDDTIVGTLATIATIGVTAVLCYYAIVDTPSADVAHLLGWGVGILAMELERR